MEGQYRICGWRSLGSLFEVWVLNNPKVQASGKTFQAADELLSEQICAFYGDGESKREYVPSPPLKSGKKLILVKVWGDTFLDAANKAELFSSERCGVCKAVKGSRTNVEVEVEKIQKPNVNAFCVSSGHVLSIFSKKFVNLIEERSGVRFLWKNVRTHSRSEWLELIGGRSVDDVVPVGCEVSGWRCSSCGITRVLACLDSDGIRCFVKASNFTDPTPQVFAITTGRGMFLGMAAEFWGGLRGESATKGVSSQALGLVLDKDISMLADFPNYEEYQSKPHSIIS